MATFIAFRAAAKASLRHHVVLSSSGLVAAIRYASSDIATVGAHRRGKDIPYRIVSLVNVEGKLEPPAPLSYLLASIDPKTHYLELVAEEPTPIVKIKEKKEEYLKEKIRRKRLKEVAAANIQKEIQMTWGVELGDLEHKLKKARKELEKGNRVDLAFAPKPNQAPPSRRMMDERLGQVEDLISDIAKEWMPRRIEKGVAVLYLQQVGRPSKGTKLATASSA